MGYIDSAVKWAVDIANNDSYRYVWGGWGASDGGYDCGHFVITAYTQAGIDVKGAGATYTGDMPGAFMKCGFQNVTNSVNLSTGSGMLKGDVLINSSKHAALVQKDGGTTVEAWCSKYGIVSDKAYRNDNWDYVLRYPEERTGGAATLQPQRQEVITVPTGLGKTYTYETWNREEHGYSAWSKGSNQRKLIETAKSRNEYKFDSDGYGLVGGRSVVAMTSTFGAVGDYVDIYCADGRVIHAIIGDEKSQTVEAWDSNPANRWGHMDGQCVVEFMTNWAATPVHQNPPSNGGVVKVINLGNYFEYPEYAAGSTESYMYSENAYSDTEKEPTVVWNNRVKENIQPKLQNTETIPSTAEPALYANGEDITKMAGSLTWKNSLHELSTTMSFNVAKTDAQYLKDLMYTPQVGDVLQYVTNGEIFRGVIIKVDDGDTNLNKYTAVDMGWYLNKTSQTYQFKNITAADAIKELCDDLSINIVMLPELTANINQIYFDKTISAILTDILDKCDGDYNYDFVPDGLRVYEIGELYAYPEFTVASNIAQEYAPDYKGNVSHSTSIEEMNNSIKVTSEKDSVYTELMVKQNRELIDRYGFLQKIVKIDPEKENAETVAEQELKAGSEASETFGFEIVEKYDSYTRAGDVMSIDGVRYVVESTDHSIKDGWHFNKLELRRIT